jgi:hypothetical protein
MSAESNSPQPLVTFFRLVPSCPAPQRADRSAGGTLPTRAFRYCEAIATAASFGWYVFPPIRFSILFNGTDVMWTYEGLDEWLPLRAAQFPDFAGQFDEQAPDDVKGFSPPFLTAFMEPGIVQIWSGLIARTAPGWSLLIRPMANFARSHGYELYEGIVDTDNWFGPLFTNVRLTKTDVPITFEPGLPLFQVQPVQRSVYESGTLDRFDVVHDIGDWTHSEWDRYRTTVVAPNRVESRTPGRYAVDSRQRRKRAGAEAKADGLCPVGSDS